MLETRKKEAGFTLIELMIVVAIIGILAAIAIPQFSAYRQRAYCKTQESDLRNLMTAEEAYFVDNSRYTATVANLPGFHTSGNVTVAVSSASATNYAATAKHSSCNSTNRVTGSVGIIR